MRRKRMTGPVSRQADKARERIKSWAIGKSPLGFSETKNPSRSRDACALLNQGRPLRFREKANQDAPIDQIEGVIRKGEWVGDIHHLKLRIGQSLGLCQTGSVLNHQVTDVNANG